MTSDPDTVAAYRLDKMRFGDFVALMDHDNAYGRAYRKGAVSIGIVVHSDCRLAGHGPAYHLDDLFGWPDYPDQRSRSQYRGHHGHWHCLQKNDQ